MTSTHPVYDRAEGLTSDQVFVVAIRKSCYLVCPHYGLGFTV